MAALIGVPKPIHHRKPAPPRVGLLHDKVLRRDGECVAAKLGFVHVCRDLWGVPHASTALPVLTVEHVHDGYGLMGRRAPSDMRHMVALCGFLNVSVPSKEMRAAIRTYLAEVNARFS